MNLSAWLWRLFCYLFFLQDYFQQTVLPQFWSLAVEIQFYMLAPFMVYNLSRLRPGLRYLSFILLMTALLFHDVGKGDAHGEHVEASLALAEPALERIQMPRAEREMACLKALTSSRSLPRVT